MRSLVYRILASGVFFFAALCSLRAQDEGFAEGTLVVAPTKVFSGEVFELRLSVKVRNGWHIYGKSGGPGGTIGTSVEMKLPSGLVAEGDWNWPKQESAASGGGAEVYTDTTCLTRKVRVVDEAGTFLIKATVNYQACNDEICGAPSQFEVRTVVTISERETAFQDDAVAVMKALNEPADKHVDALETVEPDLAFELLKFTAGDGRQVDLTTMKGKVVLLDFWAMWCVPCVNELPTVKAVYEKYQAQGFEVVGISCDGGAAKEKLLTFLVEHGYTWPQYFDGKATNNYFAKLFNITTWPTTFLIGKDGQVIEKDVRGEALEPAVRKALGL